MGVLVLDSSRWLAPLDGENPSGANLRNAPAFHDLERLIAPQVSIVRDDRNNPSSRIEVPIDWPVVLSKAEELSTQGRDLRLLVLVTRALANEHGLAGLAEGLTLIGQTFDTYWDTMHPELRPNAPPAEAALRRINALLQIQNAEDGVLSDLRKKSFFSPRGIGPISGRDLELATLDERTMLNESASGLNSTEKAALVSAHEQLVARVRSGCAAQADQATNDMASLVDDARATIAALEALDASLTAQVGAERSAAPDLAKFLRRMLATLDRATKAPAQVNGAGEQAASPKSATPAAAPNGATHAAMEKGSMASNTTLPERISSREDVVKCLDLVVDFYDRTEPSSPIPHLARRVRRMVPMDFVELMEDLAPSGLKEFRLLAGMPENRKMSQKDER